MNCFNIHTRSAITALVLNLQRPMVLQGATLLESKIPIKLAL